MMPDSPMSIPEIEVLKELPGKWREQKQGRAPAADRAMNICADEIESLIPPIEKAIVQQLNNKWADGQLSADERCQGRVREMEAELSALKETGPCGKHPRACLKEIIEYGKTVRFDCIACVQQEKAVRLAVEAVQMACSFCGNAHGTRCPYDDDGTLADKLRLERAAALEEAAIAVFNSIGIKGRAVDAIRALRGSK